MNIQENSNYGRIAEAIEYIKLNFKEQPNLDRVAQKIHLSPFHFQRMFTEWAGVSPKKFLQYISVEYAKSILREKHITVLEAAYKTGLSGSSRLHDLFMTIEGMTPGEFKNGGENLMINYSYAETPFGTVIVASTTKGICYLAFAEKTAFQELQKRFPHARYRQTVDAIQRNALRIFMQDWKQMGHIKLHLKGTEFQLKVWNALLKIPFGKLSTYGNIASSIENPKASRAVGTAIGDNPVSFLIPCHRVIQSTGTIGQYHWGSTRKTAMIGWEAVQTS